MTDFKEETLIMLDRVRARVEEAADVTDCSIGIVPEDIPKRVLSMPYQDPQAISVGGHYTQTEYETIGEGITLHIHIRYSAAKAAPPS